MIKERIRKTYRLWAIMSTFMIVMGFLSCFKSTATKVEQSKKNKQDLIEQLDGSKAPGTWRE